MTNILGLPTVAIEDIDLANSYMGCDQDLPTDVTSKLKLQDLADTAQKVVDNYTDLRALVNSYETVFVKGYASAWDGGGGMFRLIGTGGNSADIDSAGDDDDGWHLVATTTTDVYGRQAETIRPQHFGAFPHDLDSDAAAGADDSATIQRAVDLWKNPNDFNGWAFRTEKAKSLHFEASASFFRADSTILVEPEHIFLDGYSQSYTPGNMRWYGSLWVPYASDSPGFKFQQGRNSGTSTIYLKAYKQRNTGNGKAKWAADLGWPKLARNHVTWRAWAATTTFHRHERIYHTLGSGAIYCYIVDTDELTGTAGVTAGVAPTHTTGTVTDGTVDLICEGEIQTSTANGANTFREKLHKTRDFGVHVDGIYEHRDFHVDADGFAVAVGCVPCGADGNAIAFSEIKIQRAAACKILVVLTEYVADVTVADTAARDALPTTELPPTGDYRCHVKDIDEYHSWSGSAWANDAAWDGAGAGWANDNTFDMGASSPRPHSTSLVCTNTDSAYGVVIEASEQYKSIGPNNNLFTGQSVEQPNNTVATSEICQLVSIRGDDNEMHCRDDVPNVQKRTAVFYENDKEIGDKNPTLYDAGDTDWSPTRNKVVVDRQGRIFSTGSHNRQTAWNNGMWNVVLEQPADEPPQAVWDVPDIRSTGIFSGRNKFYSSKLAAWPFTSTTPLDYLPLSPDTTDTDEQNHYDAATRSFTSCVKNGFSFIIDTPFNHQGLARCQIDFKEEDPTYIDPDINNQISRWMQIRMLDENNQYVDTDDTVSKWGNTNPQVWPMTGHDNSGVDVIKWNISRKFAHRSIFLSFKPHVRRIVLTFSGTLIQGVSAKLYGCPAGSIFPVHYQSGAVQGGPWLEAAPEVGEYQRPVLARLVDFPATTLHLNSITAGRIYYATSGSTSAITPISTDPYYVLHDGAPQGSAEIFQWDGSTLNSIATNAYYTEPADWVTT